MEICEGFRTPDEGQVRVLGLDPISDSDALRSRIGVMLQGGGAYTGARAEEMVRLCASYYRDPIDPQWLLDVPDLREAALYVGTAVVGRAAATPCARLRHRRAS